MSKSVFIASAEDCTFCQIFFRNIWPGLEEELYNLNIPVVFATTISLRRPIPNYRSDIVDKIKWYPTIAVVNMDSIEDDNIDPEMKIYGDNGTSQPDINNFPVSKENILSWILEEINKRNTNGGKTIPVIDPSGSTYSFGGLEIRPQIID